MIINQLLGKFEPVLLSLLKSSPNFGNSGLMPKTLRSVMVDIIDAYNIAHPRA
jgi:hypothetical protein